MTQSPAGRPLEVDVHHKTHGRWHIERFVSLDTVEVRASAGCVELRVGALVVEVTSADARSIAWRMLEQAEQLDRPL